MLRLLFVEDQQENVEPVIRHMNRDQVRYVTKVVGFSQAEAEAKAFQPDMVVLDLLEDGGGADPQPDGNRTLDFIWRSHFCPVVVYSAHLDRLADGEWKGHPFVDCIQKGRDSHILVQTAITKFEPHVESIRQAECSIRDQFALALRAAAPYAFSVFTADQVAQRNDAILRSARRRLASLMDDQASLGSKLCCWEQYLTPPVSPDVKLGDLIRVRAEATDSPEAFRLVLSPSCDMVRSNNRVPKIRDVLVARCCTNQSGLAEAGLAGIKGDKLKDRLLTAGHCAGILPIPALKGRVPSMMADLKKLETVHLDDIGDETGKTRLVRVVSVDSPFREMVSWAYLSTACRPSLPDRDFEAWAAEIVATCGR